MSGDCKQNNKSRVRHQQSDVVCHSALYALPGINRNCSSNSIGTLWSVFNSLFSRTIRFVFCELYKNATVLRVILYRTELHIHIYFYNRSITDLHTGTQRRVGR